jgi:hypothetical protein
MEAKTGAFFPGKETQHKVEQESVPVVSPRSERKTGPCEKYTVYT